MPPILLALLASCGLAAAAGGNVSVRSLTSACDVADGTGLSSSYPCSCGGATCQQGQACTSSTSACDTAQEYTLTWQCPETNFPETDSVFLVGRTANGSPIYGDISGTKFFFHEPMCDGKLTTTQYWILTVTAVPDTCRFVDIDNDGTCHIAAAAGSSDITGPPSGNWIVYCDDQFVTQEVTFTMVPPSSARAGPVVQFPCHVTDTTTSATTGTTTTPLPLTLGPTPAPTAPTPAPTAVPSQAPTKAPTPVPTAAPSLAPTPVPTQECTDLPHGLPDSCEDYANRDWCTPSGGYGDAWLSGWGTFEDYGSPSAAEACCICGGGQGPTPAPTPVPPTPAPTPAPSPECIDLPHGLPDSCEDYVNRDWCTPSRGHGAAWQSGWGTFEDYGTPSAAEACCKCGGGQGPTPAPTPAPSVAPTPVPTEGCADLQHSLDNTCLEYSAYSWCTLSGGYGASWQSGWGTFDQYGTPSAPEACCACGGGQGPTSAPTPVPPTPASTPAPSPVVDPNYDNAYLMGGNSDDANATWLKNFHEDLSAADADGDGKISRAEALAAAPRTYWAAEVAARFPGLDWDNDGFLDSDEMSGYSTLDADGDGSITQMEAKAAGDAFVNGTFANWDADDDGQLSHEELLRASLDTNGDGKISRAEAIAAAPESYWAAEVAARFPNVDQDNDGFLDSDEVSGYTTLDAAGHSSITHTEAAGDAYVNGKFADWDGDGDGALSHEELIGAANSQVTPVPTGATTTAAIQSSPTVACKAGYMVCAHLTVNGSQGDTRINVNDTTGFVNGDHVHIEDGTNDMLETIVVVGTDWFEFSVPLEFSYNTADSYVGLSSSQDLAVCGSGLACATLLVDHVAGSTFLTTPDDTLFSVGDSIEIKDFDSGLTETASVVGIGSLELQNPLSNSYAAGHSRITKMDSNAHSVGASSGDDGAAKASSLITILVISILALIALCALCLCLLCCRRKKKDEPASDQMDGHVAKDVENRDLEMNPQPLFVGGVNDEDVAVSCGNPEYGCGHRYYCGRLLGHNAIPGGDGRCGPNSGPQCESCARYQANQECPAGHALQPTYAGHECNVCQREIPQEAVSYGCSVCTFYRCEVCKAGGGKDMLEYEWKTGDGGGRHSDDIAVHWKGTTWRAVEPPPMDDDASFITFPESPREIESKATYVSKLERL